MPPLTPTYVQAILDHFTPRVVAELDRLEAEMRTAFPRCETWRHAYTVHAFVGDTRTQMWNEAYLSLGFAQCRPISGNIHSATIFVDLGTGEITVDGWPLEEASGWAR